MNNKACKVLGVAVVLMMVLSSSLIAYSDDSSAVVSTTPASYTDAKMWVLGNADGDMDIDANDIAVINNNIGKDVKSAPMCDANHDNKIDSDDATFVQSMIDGTATTVYYYNVDGVITPFKIYKNINIVALHRCVVRSVSILANSPDNVKIVGMDSSPYGEVEFGVAKGVYGEVENVGVTKSLTSENFATLQAKYMTDSDTCMVVCIGTAKNFLADLESWASTKDYQVVRFGTWEGSTIEGLLTTGYLFSGVGNSATGGTCWDQALAYGTWAYKYLDVIIPEAAKIGVADRLTALNIYTDGPHYKHSDATRGIGSGDMENTNLCGANNIADRFGKSSAEAFTMENIATYCKDLDALIIMTFNCYTSSDVKVDEEIAAIYDTYNGYVQKGCKLYGMTWALNGAPYIVQMLWYAQIFLPDSSAVSGFDMVECYNEYLKLIGWDERTDISLNIDSVCSTIDKAPVFDKDPNGDDSGSINFALIGGVLAGIIIVAGVATVLVKRK